MFSFFFTTQLFAQTSSNPITSPRCNQFTFDASGSSDPDNESISYFWDFGDGNSSTQTIAPHTYAESGDYTVTLSITDNSGLECGTAITSQKVRVNIPPFVTFSSNDMICAGESVVFDGSASYDDSNNNLKYEWNFGDGTKTKGNKLVSKTFSQAGKYTVTLVADDNSNTVCSKQSFEKEIYVNEPPVAEAGESTLYKCISDSELSSFWE